MTELFLAVWLPWTITLCLVIAGLLSVVYIPRLVRGAWRLGPLAALVLVALVILGTYIRFQWVPNTHRIYYDEDRYMSYSVTFAKYGQAKSVLYATEKKLVRGDPDKAVRLTVPVINAWVLRTMGYAELNTHLVAKVFSSIQIILIMILAYLLYENAIVTIVAGLGMALLPGPVYWSPSAALDSYFVFFTMLSMIGIILYTKRVNPINAIFMIVSMFLLVCVRLEAFVFIPVFIYYVVMSRRGQHKQIISREDVPYMIAAALIIGVRAAASVSVLGKQWCCAEGLPIEAFYPSYFIRNLLPNITHLLVKREFPAIISILAFITVARWKNFRVATLVWWFVAYFILYSTYYAGMFYSFEFSGSYGRYFLIFIPPLLILAGIELNRHIAIIRRHRGHRRLLMALGYVLIMLVCMIPTAQSYRRMITTSPYYNQVEAGPVMLHDFNANFFVPQTTPHSLVITSMATYAAMSGRDAMLYGLFFAEPEYQDYVTAALKRGQRVYTMFPYACVSQPDETCEKLLTRFDIKIVDTKKQHPSGGIFAEVKLNTPTPAAKKPPRQPLK